MDSKKEVQVERWGEGEVLEILGLKIGGESSRKRMREQKKRSEGKGGRRNKNYKKL